MTFSDEQYLARCYELANNSTCSKAKYGSVLVSGGNIVGEGWNTSPNPECNDCSSQCAGGIRSGVKSGTRLELCHATHAEQWAVLKAGLLARGSVCYVAGFWGSTSKSLKDPSAPSGTPASGFYCTFCARILWSAGVTRIVMDSTSGPFRQTLQEAWDCSYKIAVT